LIAFDWFKILRIKSFSFLELVASNATLEEAKAASKRRGDIANVEASMATKLRQTELQANVELKRQTQLIEQLRADKLTATRVAAEQTIAEAEGRAESMRKIADAELYEEVKRAEGVQALLLAHSSGLGSIINACGGDSSTARFYLALKDDLFVKLAQEQARAVTGMQPKISVWNTGSGETSNTSAPILKLVQSFAPMLDGIHQHTDFRAPDWLIKQAQQNK
jgi:flotillin